ncbi:hypothetical protein KC19_2G168900 [Ceratodon purpureus]|uniref:Uncharacterized protein n=1 Tax=Ceratodon purpureus TaxID=3225 RepID=A0A8T0IX48_CERPU|nr:hypothetical protein KC19_2G168900 [Ceratodon purpureus]
MLFGGAFECVHQTQNVSKHYNTNIDFHYFLHTVYPNSLLSTGEGGPVR